MLEGLESSTCAYVDDLLIVSQSKKQHVTDIVAVLTCIQQARMTLRLEKYHFFQESVQYLRFIFDRVGIRPDPAKTQAILEYARPNNKSQLLSFLGLITFYQSHVPECSDICAPLFQLTRESETFIWGDEEEKAFVQIKNSIAECLPLAYPEQGRPFIFNTDASSVAIFGIIYQESEEKLNVIAMESHLLKAAERDYNTYERELLAIVHTLRKSHYLLYGYELRVVTDHKALEYLYSIDELPPRVERWRIFMQMFKITCISHVKGADNLAADRLSRFTESIIANPESSPLLPPLTISLFNENAYVNVERVLQEIKKWQEEDDQLKTRSHHQETRG